MRHFWGSPYKKEMSSRKAHDMLGSYRVLGDVPMVRREGQEVQEVLEEEQEEER